MLSRFYQFCTGWSSPVDGFPVCVDDRVEVQGLNGNEDLDEDLDEDWEEDQDEDRDEDLEEDHEEDWTVSPSPGTEGHPVDDKLWLYVGNCGIVRMVICVVNAVM